MNVNDPLFGIVLLFSIVMHIYGAFIIRRWAKRGERFDSFMDLAETTNKNINHQSAIPLGEHLNHGITTFMASMGATELSDLKPAKRNQVLMARKGFAKMGSEFAKGAGLEDFRGLAKNIGGGGGGEPGEPGGGGGDNMLMQLAQMFLGGGKGNQFAGLIGGGGQASGSVAQELKK